MKPNKGTFIIWSTVVKESPLRVLTKYRYRACCTKIKTIGIDDYVARVVTADSIIIELAPITATT